MSREHAILDDVPPFGQLRHVVLSPTVDIEFHTHVTRFSSPAGGAAAGGDWCDAVAISSDVVVLTVGDVSGHGEAVAETMEFVRAAILEAVHAGHTPSQILSMANDLAYVHSGGVIVTAIVAILNRRRRTLTFANAGHPPPLMVTTGEPMFLSRSPGDLPLGIFPMHRAAEYVVALPVDALIALYTDGVTENRRNPIEGESELARACRIVYESVMADAASVIVEHVFRNGRGSDDAAVLAVRTLPA